MPRKGDLRSDQKLVSLAVGGSHPAFAELVSRHQGSVRATAWRLTSGHASTDDIAQAAFLTAWRRLPTYSGGSFKSWVCAITYREFLQANRKEKSEIAFEESAHIINFDLAASRYDDKMDVSNAMHDLPDAQRVCITLCVAAGLTHAEAAKATGWPLGSVKSHVARGIANLRRKLNTNEVA